MLIQAKNIVNELVERIPFNKPTTIGNEGLYLEEVIKRGKFAGGGAFSKRCNEWLTSYFQVPQALITTSCTHALEMAALLCELGPGDEIILPSFTFSSTATAFARCGASLVFVDIDPQTMNVSSDAVSKAITSRTKAIVVVHYAGVPCDMGSLLSLSRKHNIDIIEDAAQALASRYDGQLCGTFGRFGCLSFHESKNIHCGEGGSLVCNRKKDVERAEIILEKGTDRLKLQRGEIDKYTWRDIGSSYVPSELNAAYLFAQFERLDDIIFNRLRIWERYHETLSMLAELNLIELPLLKSGFTHNAHIFWIKVSHQEVRFELIKHLDRDGIHAVFHYQPLHSAEAGLRFGRYNGLDSFTTKESNRLLRLPLYYGFDQVERVVRSIYSFFKQEFV